MIGHMAQQESIPFRYLQEVAQRNALHHAYLCIGTDIGEMDTCIRSLIDSLPLAFRIDCEPEEDGGSISIVQIRGLISRLSRATPADQLTLVIIAPANAMTREAANALLKILEEPPRGVIFMLFAKSMKDLLPTVVSRCHMIRFALQRPLSPNAHIMNAMQTLIGTDHRPSLAVSEELDTGDFAACESFLSMYIRQSTDVQNLERSLALYARLRLAYRAFRSHVDPQGCVDLLFL